MIKLVKNRSMQIIVLLLLIVDVITINLSSFLALWFRFDMSMEKVPVEYTNAVLEYAAIHTITTIIIFMLMHMYKRIWGFAGTNEAISLLCSCLLASGGQTIGMILMGLRMPKSYYPISLLLLFPSTLFTRFTYRIYRAILLIRRNASPCKKTKVMIIGAGAAGAIIIKDIKTSRNLDKKIVCVIDDNTEKKGKLFYGYPVEGGREVILRCVEQYQVQEIIITIPSASSIEIKNILEICKHSECELLILPGIYQLINRDVDVSMLRKVAIEDLLGRNPIRVDLKGIMGYVANKTVLVTGGGGSIGSELCRQIANYKPTRLIIFDIYENGAYDIQQEMIRRYPELDMLVLIGSVRDERKINEVFRVYKPEIVYHAAAHKHVPLMETSPNEAIKNNVFGTYKTALAASKHGVEKFILISTDKAVNPTNIMGASKRICEMIIQTLNNSSKTEFVAVRFGNVLGSNGSVIPIFKKQIEEGGPVRVTHPEIIRYFMTISEAVALVLQAGSYAKGGEIFILDMGKPVKILELAENLIRLSGYLPYTDIPIMFTGLRPGEKLFEELLMKEEGLQETNNQLIYIGKPINVNEKYLFSMLDILRRGTMDANCNIRSIVKELVPTYQYIETEVYPEELDAFSEVAATLEHDRQTETFVHYAI